MFSKLKVVELASVLAGPAAGMFFAELGAKVIKIENGKTGGDVTRSWKLKTEDPGSPVSAYFSSVNWGKEYVFSDYNDPGDRDRVIQLLKTADIVIANFKPGDDKKFGLDYNSLQKINPDIIYGNITGFGTNSHRVAYDVVLQAESGFMSMNGTAESGPVKMPVALIDVLAAHQLKEALLLALLKKERTGKGSYVEVSLLASAIASLMNQAANYLMCGVVPKPAGSLHPNIAPYGETFVTADGKQIVLAVGSDEQFRKLCILLGADEIPGDARFSGNPARVKNREELYKILQPMISKLTSSGLMQQLNGNRIPAGIIRSLDEVFSDPSIREMVLTEILEGVSTQRVKTMAFNTDFLHD